jgi:CelD/BcsL family acetyltransferase involved in cellulose biosynthesis
MQTSRLIEDLALAETSGSPPRAHATLQFAQIEMSVATDMADLKSDWHRLQAIKLNSLHQGFDWCEAWAKSHGRELAVAVGRIDGRAVFILPLDIVREKGIRVARLPGSHYNNLNTGLFDPALEVGSATELKPFLRMLRTALADHADLVVLDCVPLSWRGKRHPLSELATTENQNHSFQLPLFPNFETTLAQLNSKTRRKKFRSQSRKIEAAGGYDHVIALDADEKHALLDTFFRQKAARLKMFGLPDVFQAPEIREFFHRLVDAPMEGTDTSLTLHAIRMRGEHDGHVVAIAGVSRKGDHVICQFSSIDDSICPEASPGELLFWLMIEKSCREGAALFDFGVGDQPYKRSWCSQETVLHDMLIAITRKGSAIKPLMVLATRAKAAVKHNPRLYALLQKLRAAKTNKAA